MAYVVTRRVINRMTFLGAALMLLVGLAIPSLSEAATPKPKGAKSKLITLLILGDSLTAGFGLPAEQAFPSRLEAALRKKGHTIKVINSGISGDTTAGGRARLGWALAAKPTHAIVELGANDGLRALDPKRTRENIGAILKKLKEKGIPTLLTGMYAPPNLGRTYGDAFNSIFPDMAKKHGAALYPFFLDGVALDPKLNQRDLIHPNKVGVDVIVRRILPYVEKLIRQQSARTTN